MSPKMVGIIVTAAVLGLGTITVTVATNWVTGVNADRKEHHDAIKELQFRAKFLYGDIPAAPVTEIKK